MYLATFFVIFDTCHAQNTPGVGMESINLCTFCARAVVRIDQFVVFCCWLVLFVCTWLLLSSFFDTCHAQNTPGVGMESINLGSLERSFEMGEKVLVLLPTSTNKLLAQWQGSYEELVKKINKVIYQADMRNRGINHAISTSICCGSGMNH